MAFWPLASSFTVERNLKARVTTKRRCFAQKNVSLVLRSQRRKNERKNGRTAGKKGRPESTIVKRDLDAHLIMVTFSRDETQLL